MARQITPIVLCGGAGSRLWPLSRADQPKQFHPLMSDRTLLQATLDRLEPTNPDRLTFDPAIIVGAEAFGDQIEEQISDCALGCKSIILEPFGMDSAPALAVSIAALAAENPQAIVGVFPSDHHIADVTAFQDAISHAVDAVDENAWIVTFGIKPTGPETQFGYVERDTGTGPAYAVKRFREKPDLKTAIEFLQSGRFYWNAGMFFFRVSDMVGAFETHDPKTWAAAVAATKKGTRSGLQVLLDADEFATATKQSIDYAIMEKIDNVGIVAGHFDWSDLGSWGQLYDASQDVTEDLNVIMGDVISHDVHRSYLRSSDRLVTVAGLDDVVVVENADSVLVVHREKTSDVKELHQALKQAERPETQAYKRRDRSYSTKAAKDWLLESAVPFWAKHGLDRVHGGVFEHLHFNGTPVDDDHKRFRVLPRQIYCFAEAKRLGWESSDSDSILRNLFDHMINTGWHDDGGWIYHYNPDGSVQNPLRDTYDQCFVLLACASLHANLKWPEAREWADRTLSWMDMNLADQTGRGYLENSSKSLPRRANPHMHFLEAMLAWYEATGEQDFLDRASNMIAMFKDIFFDPKTGTLSEFFDGDWNRVSNGANILVEPGHHYEWVWLLLRYNRISPDAELVVMAKRLYAHANAFGHQAISGAALDFIMPDGSSPSSDLAAKPLDRARCWPQTEALKAACEMETIGVSSAKDHKKGMLGVLFAHYLITEQNRFRIAPAKGAKAGGWMDVIDGNGKRAAPYMPSSTFYHILCAIDCVQD